MPNRKKIYYVFTLLCLVIPESLASPDTLSLTTSFSDTLLAPYCEWAYETDEQVTIENIQQGNSQLGFKKIEGNLFHRGYGKPKEPIWFRFFLQNTSPLPIELVFEIPYPNIDRVDFYSYQEDRLIQKETTGIQFPFKHRKIKYHNFAFKINIPAGETQQHYLRLERKYDEMLLPFHLYSSQEYIANTTRSTLGDGVLIGGFFLFILILLAYVFKSQDRLGVAFLMTISAILLFHFGDGGLGFQLLWPEMPSFQQKARSLGSFISQFSFIYFTIIYFEMDKQTKFRWAKLVGYSMMAVYILLTVHVLVMDWQVMSWLPHKDFFISIFLWQLLVVILWGIGVCVHNKFWKTWDAGFYAIAFMMPALGCLVLALRNLEILPYNHMTTNFLKYAHLVMVISLGTAITKRILEVRRKAVKLEIEKNDWLQEKANHQLELVEATNMAMERERSNLGANLHDGLGALLVSVQHHFASLAHHFDNDNYGLAYKRIRDLLAQSYEETRKISHDMTLHTLKEEGFLPVVQDFCQKIENKDLKVLFWQYGLEEGLHPLQGHNCYRIIQELASNTIKHAQASELIVNISKSEGQINITVEDNGIGCSLGCAQSEEKGLGIKSIKSRVKRMMGKIDMKSEEGKGTSIFIEIPDLQPSIQNEQYHEATNH